MRARQSSDVEYIARRLMADHASLIVLSLSGEALASNLAIEARFSSPTSMLFEAESTISTILDFFPPREWPLRYAAAPGK